MTDEQHASEPRRGGVFRRMAVSKGSAAVAFSAVEELFAPARHAGRITVEEERRISKPAPAPTDPPGSVADDAVPGARRFTGCIVLHRPQDPGDRPTP